MQDYKLYRLDDRGKITTSAEWLQASSDDEAIVLVRAKRLTEGWELWGGNRLVAQVRGDSRP